MNMLLSLFYHVFIKNAAVYQEIWASSLHPVGKSNSTALHLYAHGISIFNFF